MTYPAPLSRLLVGWQKVADMYNVPVHVFQTGDSYLAVSNEAQGVRHLVETLAPRGKESDLSLISEGNSASTKLLSDRQTARHPLGGSPEHQRRKRTTRRARAYDGQRDLHQLTAQRIPMRSHIDQLP